MSGAREWRVLVVDDDSVSRETVVADLEEYFLDEAAPGEVLSAASAAEGRKLLLECPEINAVLMDHRMPEVKGLDAIRSLREEGLLDQRCVALITAYADEGELQRATAEGLMDGFFQKPIVVPYVLTLLGRSLDTKDVAVAMDPARAPVGEGRGSTDLELTSRIRGQSGAICRLRATVAGLARRTKSVLVVGETGTGKELVARSLHDMGPRSAGPFIAVNCATIPKDSAESALFGHERGAFTGAERDRRGAVRAAHRGTLFLDEVGELSADVQAKLLRVLQERMVTPMGSESSVGVDIRVVAATHRDLEAMVASGQFRRDLYHRLCVHLVAVPPLRHRGDDVVLLAKWFAKQEAESTGLPPWQFSERALDALRAHAWSGNVRELEAVIERLAVALDAPNREEAWSGRVTAGDVGLALSPVRPEHGVRETLPQPVEMTRADIAGALVASGGNRARAAKILGMSRSSFYRRLGDVLDPGDSVESLMVEYQACGVAQ